MEVTMIERRVGQGACAEESKDSEGGVHFVVDAFYEVVYVVICSILENVRIFQSSVKYRALT